MRPPACRLWLLRFKTYAAARKPRDDLRSYVSALIPDIGSLDELRKHHASLLAEFGIEPSLHDVLWRYLNEAHLREMNDAQFGLAWGHLLSMANVLRQEEHYDLATDMLCRCVYWAEAGISSADRTRKRATIEYGGAIPGLIGSLEETAEMAMLLTPIALRPVFLQAVAPDAHAMSWIIPCGSPEDVWGRIELQLWHP